jgi:hypothetical protein
MFIPWDIVGHTLEILKPIIGTFTPIGHIPIGIWLKYPNEWLDWYLLMGCYLNMD